MPTLFHLASWAHLLTGLASCLLSSSNASQLQRSTFYNTNLITSPYYLKHFPVPQPIPSHRGLKLCSASILPEGLVQTQIAGLQNFWSSRSEVSPKMCISNNFGDDADQGTHFKEYWLKLKLKLINIKFKTIYNLLPQFLAAASHIPLSYF